jgi:four helix bundle protein
MNNKYSGTDKDIHARIFKYVTTGLVFLRTVPRNVETVPAAEQVSRSLTSIGANDQEADAALTRKDFSAKYSLVLKETQETIYWWKVLKEMGYGCEKSEWLINEGKEIFKVVSVIIKNTRAVIH